MVKYKAIEQFDNMTSQLYRHLMSILSSNMQDEITLSQLLIMRQIDEGVATVGDIANSLQISPAAVSKFVDQLAREGLISRRRSKRDRRVSNLTLTPRGKEVYHKNTTIRHNIFEYILSCFNDDEVETFIEFINRVIDKLNTIDR